MISNRFCVIMIRPVLMMNRTMVKSGSFMMLKMKLSVWHKTMKICTMTMHLTKEAKISNKAFYEAKKDLRKFVF